MKTYYYRHRPHIQPPGATLFVTFRLHGSLPRKIVEELWEEYENLNALIRKCENESKDGHRLELYYNEQKQLIARYDDYLHHYSGGPHYLKNAQIAKLVCNSMKYLDGKKYDLLAYCVMSNHVHLVFTPLDKGKGDYFSIEKIMHSIKSFTANKANQILNRKGKPFWTHESFDHYSRSSDETVRIMDYVVNNPVKAGLVTSKENWQWSYSKYWLDN